MSAAGPLLSEYRKKNRLSQLDLSLLADVSSRHISFIETGRTQPSRAMLLRLADALYKRLLDMSPPQNWQQPGKAGDDGPMLTVDFKIGEQTLSLFSTLSQFGTALDIGMQELLIESYFPANDFSKKFFSELSREASD